MEKIGLVTFWNNNYGSTLQCYATKTYLEKKGYEVIVLKEENNGTFRYFDNTYNKIKKIFKLSLHPSYLKKNIDIKKRRKY